MRSRPAVSGAALVVALHLVLLWLALRPTHQAVTHDHRVWLQLWQPSAKLLPVQPVQPVLPAQPQRTPPPALPSPQVARAAPSVPDTAPVEQVPAAPVDTPEVQALLAPAAPAETVPADVVRQALKDVAAIDRQLRQEHPQLLRPSPGAPNARLARGIAAAHAAVKPKWFEQARTELISAPNDPKRIYRVTTAMGEYCLYYPDTGSIAFNSDAKSGLAGAGQPKIAGCPTPF